VFPVIAKHRGKVRNPYRGAEAPSAPNPIRTPPIPGNVAGSNPSALAGIPITPLNAVAQSASRLGLPVIETPASVDVVTAQTIQTQGYRTTTDTAQGAVGVLSGDAGGAPANFSMRGFSFGEVNTLYNGIWTGPSNIAARWMGTANLGQVEFLKGPSSLMTGLNAIGGFVFQDNLTTMDAYTTAYAYAFVDIPGRISPELKTVRVTFRVRNLTNAIYAQWADPGLQDQVLLGAPRASAKW